MPELSLHHIEQISLDIRRQEITFSHLLEDIIDHVCCDVESEMQRGLSFAEAYSRVKQKMRSRRIIEIQEEVVSVYLRICHRDVIYFWKPVQNSALA